MLTIEAYTHVAIGPALVQLASLKGLPLADVIKQNARLIAVNLALQTQPFGNDRSAQQQGELAASGDIAKVYATPQSIYAQMKRLGKSRKQSGLQLARAFYRAIKRRDFVGAERILRGSGIPAQNLPLQPFDGGAMHQRRRNGRGRVRGEHVSMIVTDEKNLDKYTRKVVRHVGMAKGGWAQVAEGLGGTRGIPHFAKRHKKSALGSLTDNTADPDEPHVIMHNNVPWIRQVLTDRQAYEALNIQRQKMLKHINTTIQAQARKAGLKSR